MPTTSDRDRGDELDSNMLGGAKQKRGPHTIILTIVLITIVTCCVFVILSTQQWFIEWLKSL